MLSMLLAATGGQAEAPSLMSSMMPLILIAVLFYFMLIRPQKKKEKQVQEMRSQVEVGDEIITVGGIIGRVVNVREDNLVIETGTDRSKLRLTRWAVQANNTAKERQPAPEVKEDKKNKKEKGESLEAQGPEK